MIKLIFARKSQHKLIQNLYKKMRQTVSERAKEEKSQIQKIENTTQYQLSSNSL